MKKFLIVMTLFSLCVSSLFAINEVVIYNKTGFDIYEIYVSPEKNTENWGLNRIPFDVVNNDSFIALDLQDYADFSEVNIKLVDKDGAVYYKVGVGWKENQKLEITMEDHSYLQIEKENWNVTFINGGLESIESISISPVGKNDFLSVMNSDSPVLTGEEAMVVLDIKPNDDYDIRFILDDGTVILKKSVRLSDGAYIILK